MALSIAESPLVFVPFDPSGANEAEIGLRARQIESFMDREMYPYYTAPIAEGGLGLRYIDEEPYTIDDRVRLLRNSGPVQTSPREYVLGFERVEGGITENEAALQALIVLKKPQGPCTESQHAPTEIAEFDLAKEYRGRGLGTVMMSVALQRIGHDEPVLLEVARTNTKAQSVYLHRSLVFTGEPPVRHGVYDVDHLKMATTTLQIARTLPGREMGQ